jgi:hypothetical protein
MASSTAVAAAIDNVTFVEHVKEGKIASVKVHVCFTGLAPDMLTNGITHNVGNIGTRVERIRDKDPGHILFRYARELKEHKITFDNKQLIARTVAWLTKSGFFELVSFEYDDVLPEKYMYSAKVRENDTHKAYILKDHAVVIEPRNLPMQCSICGASLHEGIVHTKAQGVLDYIGRKQLLINSASKPFCHKCWMKPSKFSMLGKYSFIRADLPF